MLIDYEEDDIFNTSINSSKLEEQINHSPITSKSNLSSSHFLCKSNYSLDEIENETSINMISKLNNTHLLKLLSELVRTFFEITHEIEFCLNCYINKQKLALLKQIKSSDQSNKLTNIYEINKPETNNLKINTNENNLNLINQANEQINQFEDEIVYENVLPIRNVRKPKKTETKSQFNDSIVLKESNAINNSNYFEISCSYIVQLNTFNNSNSKKQSIVEDKKTYISANININNCYKSKNNKEIIKKNSSIDSEEETYSDTTTDLSDNLEYCPSYNFLLKSKPNQIINQIEPQQKDFKELIDKKMMNFNKNFINLTKCENLIDFKNVDKIEINKYDSNYSDYLEEEDLVVALCTRLKEIIKELIQFLNSISTGNLDKLLKDLLDRNSDLSTKLTNLKQENLKIENQIKNINDKDSNLKLEIINLKDFLNEYKQNQDRLEFLKSNIDELKNEINKLKEEEENRLKEVESRLNGKKDLLYEDGEIFQDCLENLEDNCENNFKHLDGDKNDKIILFDKIQFENTFKSIQQSGYQKTMINLINDEKFELNKLINKLKNEIEQLILNNEEIKKLKEFQFEDYTQNLNCLKKLINSNRKFLNEQTFERDNEKDTFDTKLTRLNCLIKEKDLSLNKCKEKAEFSKTDLEDLLTEKDELQCKNYNQGRKLIDLLSKQDELIQSIDKLQNDNNLNFNIQEELRIKLEDLEKRLNEEKLLFDKLKFDEKIEIDDFLKILDDVIIKINRYYMKEKIREHLKRKKLIDKSNQNKLTNLRKSKSFMKTNDDLSNSLIKKSNLRNSLKIDCSTPIRTNSFSLHKSIKPINQLNNKIPRSKSFMNDEFENLTKLNRRSLKLNDESFTNFLSKLKSPKERILDDEEFYSFKDCQSLISLNNDLDNFNNFKSDDSLYSLKSSILDESLIENTNFNFKTILNSSTIDAQHSLSEDTFYFSLTTSEENTNQEFNLNELYLDKCKDADKIKLKHYANVIIIFFQKIKKNINQLKDNLQNTTLNNKTKQVKLIELKKTFEHLKLIYVKEKINLENLQNKLNNKHLELSELKDQIDSNLDNSLFIENKQVRQDLEQRMIDNENNEYTLKKNLEHLEKSIKRKDNEFSNLNDELINIKKDLNLNLQKNEQLKIDNQNLEKENLELNKKLKKMREEKLYKKLKMIKN